MAKLDSLDETVAWSLEGTNVPINVCSIVCLAPLSKPEKKASCEHHVHPHGMPE